MHGEFSRRRRLHLHDTNEKRRIRVHHPSVRAAEDVELTAVSDQRIRVSVPILQPASWRRTEPGTLISRRISNQLSKQQSGAADGPYGHSSETKAM
jgi:hypothetical protein